MNLEWNNSPDAAHQFIEQFYEIAVEQGREMEPTVKKRMARIILMQILPFISKNTLRTTDETLWPVSIEDFNRLNDILAIHFPHAPPTPALEEHR